MDNRPIGVFDSGLGGLTGVRELRKRLPHEEIIYFGDTGRVPYGSRSPETILQYARQDVAFLLSKNVKCIMAACFLKKYVVALYNSLGVYLPLITTNCCVLAVTILVVGDYGADVAAMGFGVAYIEALVCAIGAGCGFMLAMVMFSGVRKRVEACDPPAPFKGLPITLIAAAITSLSFMGFGGLVENLFNVTL